MTAPRARSRAFDAVHAAVPATLFAGVVALTMLAVQPALTALSNDIGLDARLFARVKAVWEGPREGLSETDIRLLEQTYKGFVRSGAALSEEDKALYRQ